MNSIEIVTDAIEYVGGVDRSEITISATLEDLGLDSLDKAEIVMKLEKQLSISIDDDIADEWETVGDAINYLDSLNSKN